MNEGNRGHKSMPGDLVVYNHARFHVVICFSGWDERAQSKFW